MKIGDIIRVKPTFGTTIGMGELVPQPAEVVYIHPKGRFYTVRFIVEGGGSWRESFLCADRCPGDTKERKK